MITLGRNKFITIRSESTHRKYLVQSSRYNTIWSVIASSQREAFKLGSSHFGHACIII